MATFNKEIRISGGDEGTPREPHSQGKFEIDVDLATREVAVSFPDRFGVPGEFLTFAPEAWDAIVAVINEAELQRGKVVSTTWSGE